MDQLKQLARDNKVLFWDIKDIERLSSAAISERLINYGDWNTFTALFGVLSAAEYEDLFKQLTSKKRPNLRPEAENLAKVYASKYYAAG